MSDTPIRSEDAVHVKGKYLFKGDGTRFIVKGIAFPTPPETLLIEKNRGYHADAWLDVLKQLRRLKLSFNTIRLYRMYPEYVDYHEFFEGAAKLGVYVIVPLTAASGPGVLDRKLSAPSCYKKRLFHYGANALKTYLKYPNVLGGMVGNEVMNDETAWLAAPCVRSYARDLKIFMDRMVEGGVFNRTLPLVYAAQDSATVGGAQVDKNTVLKLTVDYLTCIEDGKGTAVVDVAGNEPIHGLQHFSENKFGQSPIDIYGVNVESWCSSTEDFRHKPDGSDGSYFAIWKALQNSSVPIIFSEMGCPHSQFDRDDLKRKTKEGTRDWAQVPIVWNEMSDSWSGFIAYTYDGPKDFVMFDGGEWNGRDILSPTKDFENFKNQLYFMTTLIESKNSGILNETIRPSSCNDAETGLLTCCNLRMFNDDMIPSYAKLIDIHTGKMERNNVWIAMIVFSGALSAIYWKLKQSLRRRNVSEGIALKNGYSAQNKSYSSL